MRGKDLIAATLFGGGGGSSGGGGISQADIDAAFAALAEKGVTVPDGATSADLDDLIASIVTGGASASSVAWGTYTCAENVSLSSGKGCEVTHNLGYVPTSLLIMKPNYVNDGSTQMVYWAHTPHWQNACFFSPTLKKTSYYNSTGEYGPLKDANETTLYLQRNEGYLANMKAVAGDTLYWIAY